jgi:two-component system, OmpR family, sensor kinase
MIFHSIRWRLQAWYGLILVMVLTGFGLTAYQVARDNQLRRIDQDLNQRLMALLSPPPPEPMLERRPGEPPSEPRPRPFDDRAGRPLDRPPEQSPDLPFRDRFEQPPDGPARGRRLGSPEALLRMRNLIEQGGAVDASQTNTFYYVLWQGDGSVLARSPGAPANVPWPDNLPQPPPQGYEERPAPEKGPRPNPGPGMLPVSRTRGQARELFRPLPRGQCVLVGRSLVPDLAAMRRLALWLTVAGGAVLMLGLAGGWWVATRTIRPINQISATATKIAAGDLSQRIDAADTDSELGRLANVLNSTFARLEAAFAQQAQFTSDASHELRTPVSVILAQTQTALSRDRTSPEYVEALEACQRAARRMKGLTQSLLELARLDAGQEPMKRVPVDLARVARECVELVRPLAAERGIQLLCDMAATECVGDAERLSQVITNLLSNAIHFNRERGEVRISARVDDRLATLIVTDTGQGIPAEDLPNLFKRFYRADKSRSRVQGRNGLGLAICKAIVDAHGGTIEVTSQPGAGSSFTVKLPQS